MRRMSHPSWAVEPIGTVPENMLPTMGSRGQGVPHVHISKLPHPEEGDNEAIAAAIRRARKLRAEKRLKRGTS